MRSVVPLAPAPTKNTAPTGMQTAKEQGDRIGILLDLDQGSMSVWKNGERLGVMQAPEAVSKNSVGSFVLH